MGRTKQTARKSTGGKAPRKQLAASERYSPIESKESSGKGGKGKGGKGLGKGASLDEDRSHDREARLDAPAPTGNNRSGGFDDVAISDELKDNLLKNFADDAKSSKVELCFSFDTTGSMSSVLDEVRRRLSTTVDRLFKDIPEIRIGIIAHGDYCDSLNNYATRHLDLCNDPKKLIDFINTVSATGGGDSPECYELALRVATSLSWSNDASKALVVIGDEVPHPPSYTSEKINWFDVLATLAASGVKVYGVRALHSNHAIPFYEELSQRTGAVSLHFSHFPLITEMFLAICKREAGNGQLEEYQQELEEQGVVEGEMKSIFKQLAQPNKEKSSNKSFKCTEPWYCIENDTATRPSFSYDAAARVWRPVPF